MISDIKLIMTLLVRDEEDIIKENIDFHLSQGVDFFIVTDNLSQDSTPQILDEYIKRGVLHYIHEERDNYNQHEWVTKMTRMASIEYEADWVINNDADEFWWPKTDSLKDFFKIVPDEFNLVEAKRHNFVAVKDSGKFYNRMIYKEINSTNHLGLPLTSKVAHRANPNVQVHQGNHRVSGLPKPAQWEGGIEIFHFPIRTYEQFLNKIKKGGAAYERNQILKKSIGKTWRKLYKNYKREKNLKSFYEDHYYDDEQIKKGINANNLIKDTRLKNHLTDLYQS